MASHVVFRTLISSLSTRARNAVFAALQDHPEHARTLLEPLPTDLSTTELAAIMQFRTELLLRIVMSTHEARCVNQLVDKAYSISRSPVKISLDEPVSLTDIDESVMVTVEIVDRTIIEAVTLQESTRIGCLVLIGDRSLAHETLRTKSISGVVFRYEPDFTQGKDLERLRDDIQYLIRRITEDADFNPGVDSNHARLVMTFLTSDGEVFRLNDYIRPLSLADIAIEHLSDDAELEVELISIKRSIQHYLARACQKYDKDLARAVALFGRVYQSQDRFKTDDLRTFITILASGTVECYADKHLSPSEWWADWEMFIHTYRSYQGAELVHNFATLRSISQHIITSAIQAVLMAD